MESITKPAFVVIMPCSCGGMMEYDKTRLEQDSQYYLHICTKCKLEESLERKYPYLSLQDQTPINI